MVINSHMDKSPDYNDTQVKLLNLRFDLLVYYFNCGFLLIKLCFVFTYFCVTLHLTYFLYELLQGIMLTHTHSENLIIGISSYYFIRVRNH